MARSRRRRWIFLLIVAAVIVAIVVARTSGPSITNGSWLLVEIDGAYGEGPPDGLLVRVIEERKVLMTLLRNLRKAARDDRIAGVVARVGHVQNGWARAREIREALADVKAHGKRVVAFIRGDSPQANKDYYIASVADRVYLAPGGAAMLNGLAANFFFLGGVWDKADIEMDVEQIREYKTFGDMLSRRDMSDAHRAMANWVLDGVDSEFIGTLAEARGMSVEQVRSIIDSCPATPDGFVEAGLADGVLFYDQVEAEIGGEQPANVVKESTYEKVPESAVGLGGGPGIAVIHAAGTIVPGKGDGRGMFGGTVGSWTLARAFREAVADSNVRAVVFRIDSPGGSATASDEVWRAVRRAREQKPVVASLGDTAASGGYYIASAADKIVAASASLTGSIGVVLFKPDVGELMENIGVTNEVISRGRYATLFDMTKELDEHERRLLRSQMEHTYRLFVNRVAESRAIGDAEVDAVGGGRVWTGRQAMEHRLVDEIGGIQDAVRLAAAAAGIEDPVGVELVFYPQPEGFLAQLGSLRSAAARALLPSFFLQAASLLGPAVELDPGVHVLGPAGLSVD